MLYCLPPFACVLIGAVPCLYMRTRHCLCFPCFRFLAHSLSHATIDSRPGDVWYRYITNPSLTPVPFIRFVSLSRFDVRAQGDVIVIQLPNINMMPVSVLAVIALGVTAALCDESSCKDAMQLLKQLTAFYVRVQPAGVICMHSSLRKWRLRCVVV